MLTPEQIQDLRKLLWELESALREKIQAGVQQQADPGANDAEADAGNAAINSNVDHSSARIAQTPTGVSAELQAIEGARQRLQQNTYGLCIACLCPVGFERLLALPTAERCLTCQEYHEWGTLDHMKTRQ